MTFIVHVDDAATKDYVDQLGKQLPFAVSVVLNRTIDEAQDAIRRTLPGHFTLRRRQFVERTIYRQPGVDFATKANLQAGLRIHPTRDFLAKFEYGGAKRPTRGKYVAIPLEGARATFGDIVPRAYRLQALFANPRAFIKHHILYLRQGRGKNARAVPMYLFRATTPLPSDLHFIDTGLSTITARWEINLGGVLELLAAGKFSSISAPQPKNEEPT